MAGTPSITYRRARPADAPGLACLMADPAVFGGLLQLPYPTAETWSKRLEARAEDPLPLHLLALAGDEVIGSAGVHWSTMSPRTRHSVTLGISVAVPWQRQGIGSELMRRVLDYADNWAGFLRVELSVYVDNPRAIALYERAGFTREGVKRAHALRDGKYVDSITMARLHPSLAHLPRVTA
jgi:putative acetyltransferase